MLSEQEKAVAQYLLSFVFNDEQLSKPVYCKQVRSEQDAERLSGDLPLVYVWNENRQSGTFAVSVNGPILGDLLEGIVPRDDPSFVRIRDEAMSVLAKTSQGAVVSTCQKIGAYPSDLF